MKIKMVESSKQVRVDNWGIFFLSRLQVFFNKTDYCDLTLQFEGNVQLKVHRLVMNACTDYFQVLEQNCQMVDDVLLMPSDLQADVILPIVNFMYTGVLEFQMSLFEKLYKTAELMNIPVLLKLLDAQKQSHHNVKLQTKQPTYAAPPLKKVITPTTSQQKTLPATLPGRKLPVWKRKTVPTQQSSNNYMPSSEPKKLMIHSTDTSSSSGAYENAAKPTRFEWPEEDLKNFNLLETSTSSFDNISYTSKPLLTQEEEFRPSTSFDDVKYLPSNSSKRIKDHSSNVDMEDLKNYVKEQKIRTDLLDLEDDEDYEMPVKRKLTSTVIQPQNTVKKMRINDSDKETKINITSSSKELDHTKIISEVLKKYPHLVKKNKNIRLKILAKNETPKSKPKAQIKSVSKITMASSPAPISTVTLVPPPQSPIVQQKTIKVFENKHQQQQQQLNNPEGPWICNKCPPDNEPAEFVLYYLYRKHMTAVHNEKFDSLMCKYCGHHANKHNMLMYHQYTKHGVKPPAAYNFPKCPQCPYIALTDTLMYKHKLNHTKNDSQCLECKIGFNGDKALKHHMQITGHTGKMGRLAYDCQYCTKHYQTGANLFSHIRSQHREDARRDGIVSVDEDDELESDIVEEQTVTTVRKQIHEPEEKVKILSNLKLQNQDQTLAGTSSSTLATSLGLVDIVVLDENQQYILHSNDQQPLNENPEFILPDLSQSINQVITSEHNVMLNNSDIASTDELVMVLTDHDYNDGNNEILTNDNSNIVVLYSHPVEGQENQFITSQGNIMLNAETGMLEIRNDGISATSTETVVTTTSQPSTVESIEMIQREIESHNIAAIDKNKRIIQMVTTTAPSQTVAQQLSTAITLDSLAEVKTPTDTVVDSGILSSNSDVSQVEITEPILSTELMESDSGNVDNIQTLSEASGDIIQTDNLDEPVVLQQPLLEATELDQQAPSIVDLKEDAESIVHIETVQIAPETSATLTPSPQPIELIRQEKCKVMEDITIHPSNIAAPEQPKDAEESQEQTAATATDVLSTSESADNSRIEENESQDGDAATSLPIDGGTAALAEENTKGIVPDVDEPDSSQNAFEQQAEPMEVDEALTEKATQDEVPEQNSEIVDTPEEPPQANLPDSTSSVPAVAEISRDIPPDTLDNIEKELASDSGSMPNKTPSEPEEGYEPEPMEVDGGRAEDAAAAVAAATSTTPPAAESRESKAEAAKISILDDWEEDTDSQQSDHGKSSSAVNKLITDWDDD